MRISDWSSDVCSSDLQYLLSRRIARVRWRSCRAAVAACGTRARLDGGQCVSRRIWCCPSGARPVVHAVGLSWGNRHAPTVDHWRDLGAHRDFRTGSIVDSSEEHTSELQSLICISVSFFCLKKKILHSTSTLY